MECILEKVEIDFNNPYTNDKICFKLQTADLTDKHLEKILFLSWSLP